MNGGKPDALAGENAATRAAWLHDSGPHALVRAVRAGGDSVVLALTVRPGGERNTICNLALRLVESGGEEVGAAIPVYDLYRRQWSLDLTVGVRDRRFAGPGTWCGELVVTDAAGEASLPLLSAGPEAFSLAPRAPLKRTARLWRLCGQSG